MKRQRLAPFIRKKLWRDKARHFKDKDSWLSHLERLEICRPRHIRIATEAALVGRVLTHEFRKDTVIMSDDAGQFDIFHHVLCWIHIERNIHKLIPVGGKRLEAVESVRTAIWELYQQLKSYKKKPGLKKRRKIEKAFDAFCDQTTCYQLLNNQLKKIKKSKGELLMVLDRPEIPLQNNLSERDIREYVKRRKLSGSTRSDAGRACRDTFASLKKTALKLNVGFWPYLMDRIREKGEIEWLPTLLLKTAQNIPNP